jgi:hypothetical protein
MGTLHCIPAQPGCLGGATLHPSLNLTMRGSIDGVFPRRRGVRHMTYDLQKFGMLEMIDAGRRLRHPGLNHTSMEAAAGTVVDFFHDCFRTGDGPAAQPNCALVRCFITHPYGGLPLDLQRRAAALSNGHPPTPGMQCLTLLATRGELPAWNSRFTSSAHQVIPLPTVKAVAQAPMISQLVLQLGMKIEQVVRPAPQPREPRQTFDVFHVESALGSGMVPDQQQFVERYGIKSVLGFGGLLPAGDMFAVILFTRVTVKPETAALFRTLALGVKLSLLPFSGKRVFAPC